MDIYAIVVNLNTSHVKVNPAEFWAFQHTNNDLNTSHVKVNQERTNKEVLQRLI